MAPSCLRCHIFHSCLQAGKRALQMDTWSHAWTEEFSSRDRATCSNYYVTFFCFVIALFLYQRNQTTECSLSMFTHCFCRVTMVSNCPKYDIGRKTFASVLRNTLFPCIFFHSHAIKCMVLFSFNNHLLHPKCYLFYTIFILSWAMVQSPLFWPTY